MAVRFYKNIIFIIIQFAKIKNFIRFIDILLILILHFVNQIFMGILLFNIGCIPLQNAITYGFMPLNESNKIIITKILLKQNVNKIKAPQYNKNRIFYNVN